jgi:NADH:ubiquinone oxidoreductase subunit 6 (subunit J)
MIQYIFYFFAFATCFSALIVVFTKNILYAAFALLGVLLGISALYVLANADFLAITQIVVYVGGVLVLIIFGIMLTQSSVVSLQNQQKIPASKSQYMLLSTVIAFVFFNGLLFAILKANLSEISWLKEIAEKESYIKESTVADIGVLLMTNYLLPFEIIALLLLVALIGATNIAGKNKR